MKRYKVHLHGEPLPGHRIVVVLTEGRIWTTLFYPPTLTRFRIPNTEFALSVRQDLGPVGRTTLGILARTEKVYKRDGLQYSRKAVEQIRRAA